MKKAMRFAAILVMIFMAIGGESEVFAYSPQPKEIQDVKVYIDGATYKTKESFYSFDNTTLVPMREFFERLGATLEWDSKTQTIVATSDDKTIELVIDHKIAKINGKDNPLSVGPKIINDHTYVPLRFIAEALMYEVDWNRKYNIITIIDMGDIKEITRSKTYKSSNFFETDYIEMEILDDEKIKIKGRTSSGKTDWMFWVDNHKQSDIIKEYKQVGSNGTYENIFLLKGKLREEKNRASIYFKEKNENMYWGYYNKIPLSYVDGELFFPVSPVYANNYLQVMKNSVIDPNNFLKMTITNQGERNQIIDLANTITKDARSDYDKLLKISDWVADNIYYNWDGYLSGVYGATDAYGTFQSKKSVCQGYAELTRELLRALGIPARLVSGYALGVGTDGEDWAAVNHTQSNHAWNEAFVDNRWVIVDTTWNSANKYQNKVFTKGIIGHRYFDPSLEVFSNTHKIISLEW